MISFFSLKRVSQQLYLYRVKTQIMTLDFSNYVDWQGLSDWVWIKTLNDVGSGIVKWYFQKTLIPASQTEVKYSSWFLAISYLAFLSLIWGVVWNYEIMSQVLNYKGTLRVIYFCSRKGELKSSVGFNHMNMEAIVR